MSGIAPITGICRCSNETDSGGVDDLEQQQETDRRTNENHGQEGFYDDRHY